ncbi:hypothetical protein DFH06DRAFT_1304300 [Mycena polygramma]|nr:hypothetical protein DFH06DRAFT_1304300 [Mycena polygramma]
MAQSLGDTRVKHLWFSSETLVLRAETKIFQVPKALLAARSSVFRDMVGFPQPPGTEMELHEGIPVVALSDAALDVDAFLTAILDSSFFMPAPEPVDFDALIGILRLAHKYDVPYLYLRALKRLSIRYEAQSAEQYLIRKHDYITTGGGSYFRDCIKLIQALTEVGALWLLPVAYYNMCSMDQALLLQNVEGHETLILKCVGAQAALRKGTVAVVRLLITPSSSLCTDSEHCNNCRLAAIDQYFSIIGAESPPLQNWKEIWEEIPFCSHCETVVRDYHDEALQEFWDDLPNIFGLPPWPELHAMRDAVMNGSGPS